MSSFLNICRRRFVLSVLWFGRRFLGWGRLEGIELIDLGASLADVVAVYGEPIETNPDEYLADAVVYTFSASPFHEVVVVEWMHKVCMITYWTPYGEPNRDLKCMLDKYGQEIGWNELEPGYVCVRKDEQVWLRCSAMPAVSVETAEYLDAKRDASTTD